MYGVCFMATMDVGIMAVGTVLSSSGFHHGPIYSYQPPTHSGWNAMITRQSIMTKFLIKYIAYVLTKLINFNAEKFSYWEFFYFEFTPWIGKSPYSSFSQSIEKTLPSPLGGEGIYYMLRPNLYHLEGSPETTHTFGAYPLQVILWLFSDVRSSVCLSGWLDLEFGMC